MKSYFSNPKTVEELRKQYTQLMKKYHPDNGGTEEEAKEINSEYDILFERLKNIHENGKDAKEKYDKNIDAELRKAINKIIHIDGLNIEICGSWVWVSGNTYNARNELKAAGYHYSKNKKSWYFHTGEYKRSGKKTYSMDYIRAIHGSIPVDSETLLKLA